ncbi:hypothetical protein L6452_28261 [Arctium lappa]|uniref:Uncharacterized protein n=1 Tax=Arctium lappa TaxID=4217 RepID=A0ACB8ZY82_ARCLA|nr:hypothetical protein L6452_28261 [Arctium lappa]
MRDHQVLRQVHQFLLEFILNFAPVYLSFALVSSFHQVQVSTHEEFSFRHLLLTKNSSSLHQLLVQRYLCAISVSHKERIFCKAHIGFWIKKPISEYTSDELLQYKVDRDIKANLMLALPNFIYNRIDCYKNNPKLMWAQLEKIMLGSIVATQLRHTHYMNNFEEFKAKDEESLKNVFDRFCAVINDLRKIKVEKTELETNLKFLNSLQSEWNKSCHRLRNDVRIYTMQIQEMYEIFLTDECIVKDKKAKLDKKTKKTVDPVSLLTSKLAEQALSENAYDGATDDDGEALQKAMILLSRHYHKKFQHHSGSNNLRFTSGSKNVKVPKVKKAVACFNCGKSGHIAKECRVKKVRDSAYYRKKMELAEKRENGTALLAEV